MGTILSSRRRAAPSLLSRDIFTVEIKIIELSHNFVEDRNTIISRILINLLFSENPHVF